MREGVYAQAHGPARSWGGPKTKGASEQHSAVEDFAREKKIGLPSKGGVNS
jgi:hypothetical protein